MSDQQLQEFITVRQAAARAGVTRARILQLLQQRPELRARCQVYGTGATQKPSFILLPADLFRDYQPLLHRQAAGALGGMARTPAKARRGVKKTGTIG